MTDRDRMDPRFAAALEQVLTARIERDVPAPRPSGRGPAVHGRRTVWVTAVVGLVVAVLAVATIQATGDRDDGRLPAATSTRSSARIDPTLLQHLPAPSYGSIVHTWTDRHPEGSGPFDVTGSTVVIAAVCEGGGAITIHDASGEPHLWVCNRRVVQQPFWRTGSGGEDAAIEDGPVRASVSVVRGHPRFIVRMWKVDPRTLRSTVRIANTGPAVPRSLRSCTVRDLAPTGTLAPLPGEHAGVVTITNRSSTDCAIRSWPGMTYLDGGSRPIGPTQGGPNINGRSIDSREGAENAFHEFPPARLTAGGRGFLIVDLFTRARLEKDDRLTRAAQAEAEATPAPSPSLPLPPMRLCRPVTVAALRLDVSGATVIVEAPAAPARAACANDSTSFGVNPVVTENPADE